VAHICHSNNSSENDIDILNWISIRNLNGKPLRISLKGTL